MAKVREFFSGIGKRLKALPKGKQGRAFVRILQFFAIMLVLTLFARGAAAVTLPEVTWQTMSTQQIRNADDYAGTVTATNKVDVKLPQGLTVQRVYAQPGAQVAEGDSLLSFDTDTLEQNLVAARIALEELRLELARLQQDYERDQSALDLAKKDVEAAQKALDEAKAAVGVAEAAVSSAQASYNQVKTRTDAEVAEAQRKHDMALPFIPQLQAEVDNKKLDFEQKLAALEADPTNPTKFQDAENARKAYEDALEALAPYQADIDGLQTAKNKQAAELQTAQAAIDAAKQSVTAAKTGVENAQKALDKANEDLAKAQKEYDQNTPEYELEMKKRRLQIQQKRDEIEKQQEMVAKLEEMSAAGGLVKAPTSGVVTNVTAVVGAVTGEADYVRISTGQEGYMVEFTVPQEKAREIKVGDNVSVKYSNYYWGFDARITAKSMPGEGGAVTVRAQLNSTDFSDGDGVTVTVVKEDRQYGNCVPVAAVRPDSDGSYYVLVLDEKSTILGKQTVARKVTVTITAQDKTWAAIDGLYENQPRIVVSSTKAVNDGNAVRIAEESSAT